MLAIFLIPGTALTMVCIPTCPDESLDEVVADAEPAMV
ncbi:hypothetical protein M23134_06260 [Microscilla marina ATCC 23134]|uniref:Uncharacterized protein n=1 Tax=Microscilla marina ATCC 23134 TaxID=313606 RepID=A1ZYL5_MICM2|nr:hypothetical protein M23134_06260 [Microscilla marina ATCC 23134]